MNKWFLRENPRRYFRINMPVHIFITSAVPIDNLEIYATGINYFPKLVKKQIKQQLDTTHYWLNQVQEHKEVIAPLFKEVIYAINTLEEAIKKISTGINPCHDLYTWSLIEQKKQGFTKLNILENHAPKTLAYLKLLEDKFLIFLNSFIISLKKSSPQQFASNSNIPKEFKIDNLITKLNHPKFEKIPLLQAIIALTTFMNTILNIYQQINDNNIIQQSPLLWPLITINLSATGLSLFTDKDYPKYGKVSVSLYFADNKKILKFKGVVTTHNIDLDYKHKIAINFELPDGKPQDFLIFKIQEHELNMCNNLQF